MIRTLLLLALSLGAALGQTSMGIGSPLFNSSSSSSSQLFDAIISKIRNLTKTWTPGRNPLPPAFYRGSVRLEQLERERLPAGILVLKTEVQLPESFDARTRWPNCPSIGEIRNQGCCGSCWAISAAAIMTDRWCIHSPDSAQFTFGAFDILACCKECGNGCDGGDLGPAWTYWVEHGVSSGGPHNSRCGCHPYPFDVCRHRDEQVPTPKCVRTCQATYNQTDATQDIRFGREAYSVPMDESRIMEEIFMNGPVQATFKMYEDFRVYKSGVYRHVWGPLVTGHAIKIIGWGVEKGTKYWLCINSWGESWGSKGLFKIIRGENHLNIERDVHTGLPDYRKHEEMFSFNY
ncbi:cathepsin B-like cysteine proteinase [Sabethes cyaneus]|uniref:cathepsin B-like cysteine proteinase n=1 Tax=Sabethes cyaneus TaxID=53552 RepID=UPI00237EA7C0|nr:cathepsin B-like cysteine proteinase [Sabethes cyaneus]